MERSLDALLSWWELSGVDVPEVTANAARKPRPKAEPVKAPKPEKPAEQKAPLPDQIKRVENAKTAASGAANLDALRTAMSNFDAGEISDHARQAVFSRGNPDADIMIIGEAPGRDEDIQGKPFVGKSGQFLDKIFASIGLNEDNFYITNVINWRPPGNRNPTAEEIEICRPFLQKHIALIEPKIIVLVGGISFTALTGGSGIMKNRGQWTGLTIDEKDIPALPVYHPAFLLRRPELKKDMWHDMLSLRAKIAELT